nr:hypothetical protein [Tanacetum cinerariifolium]
KPGLVTKRCNLTRSLSRVDEFVDEGIPKKEPRFDDEEADMQRAVEESLKSVHGAHRGPLSPVVFREPDSGKFQPLPETSKKKIPADPFIFQMHTSTPTKSSGIDPGVQKEGQARPNSGEQDVGQAGPNPGDAASSQP